MRKIKDFHFFCDSKMISGYAESIFAVLVSMALSFTFLLNSPLHPWVGGDSGTDSSVFKTVTMMMEKGYMPYRDSFDHKGPLIYLINWLGDQIAAYRGVWCIEFIFMTVTLFVMYKTARLLCGKVASIVAALTAFSPMFLYFYGGNFVEEYAMAFIAISQFIFLDYFKNDKVSGGRVFLCGLCLGCTLLLRPNMIALWIVMCMAVLIRTMAEKSWKKLGGFVLWFCLGMVSIILPIMIWLAVRDSLRPFWDAYIVFNQRYSSAAGRGEKLFGGQWRTFFFFSNTRVCVLSLLSLLWLGRNKNRLWSAASLLCILLTLGFICISGEDYIHYGMILVPVLVYPLALLLARIESLGTTDTAKLLFGIVCVWLLSSVVMPDWLTMTGKIPAAYLTRDQSRREEVVEVVAFLVDQHTTEDEKISVYGNWDIIYLASRREHATKYSYQTTVGQIMPELKEEYMTQLQEELPPVIVVEEEHYDENITAFLNRNEYRLLWQGEMGNPDTAAVYIR